MGLRARLNRTNGWQRIWLVLVLLALVSAYPFALSLAAKHALSYDQDVGVGFENPACASVIAMPAGSKLNPAPGYDSPCSSLYIYRSVYDDAATTQTDYVAHITREQNHYANEAMPWFVLAVAVVAGLIYGAGVVVGWIRRGFEK